MKSFDRKFGAEFFAALPVQPGVYRVYDASDVLIYVGKAKNLRRRLGQYRNAKRRKRHLKMRAIIRDAARIETVVCDSELDACLLEAREIQAFRPKWNVAGAFFFLYPMIGVSVRDGAVWFCYTREPEKYSSYRFHGAFRSRQITGEAFFALMELLKYVGHSEKRAPRQKGVYEFGFRGLPSGWCEKFEQWLAGEASEALAELILCLVENAGARRRKGEIQELFDLLLRFERHEIKVLKRARARAGWCAYPVSQRERDIVFIQARYNQPGHHPPKMNLKSSLTPRPVTEPAGNSNMDGLGIRLK
jgi:excinuclease ABC subunit C